MVSRSVLMSLVAHAQGLANPAAGLEHHRHQEAIPQPVAGGSDRPAQPARKLVDVLGHRGKRRDVQQSQERQAVEEPSSLADLRSCTTAMLPRVDLPEVILEVMSWVPELATAFTTVSGGRSRLEDLPTSIAACLAAHSMNIGHRPIAKKGVPGPGRPFHRSPSMKHVRDHPRRPA